MALAPRLLLLVLLLATGLLKAATVTTEISGIHGELLANVLASLALARAERFENLSLWRLRQMADDARAQTEQAMRPFGYYRPRIQVRLIEPEDDSQPWHAIVEVEPGAPVTVDELTVEIRGEGKDDPELKEWREDWPLQPGDTLDHRDWQAAWQALARTAEERGYFQARFEQRRALVDAERQQADINLVFNTGPRYRFGSYRAPDQPFSERLMDRLDILAPDEPYSIERLDRQREVLARSGLFEQALIEPERDDERERVDLRYELKARPPNTWRATLGFGTDTGARIQLGWSRHYLSSKGDRFEAALGAQQRRREYVLHGEYQHPRGSSPGEFLTAGTTLRSEQDDFRFYDQDRVEPVFDSFSGRRDQAELIVGRLRERTVWTDTFQPLEERLFVSVLSESFDAFRERSFSPENEALLDYNPALRSYLDTDSRTVALGARWRLPRIEGSGFNARGTVWGAQLLGAHKSLGSDVSFAQAWLSGRWHFRLGERHKLLLRGEAGYTRASVRRLVVELDDRSLDLSLTELPERYRFKTGGDRTVRGYGFEELSINRNGGNHLLVGSVEYEYRVGVNWSLAAFADIGNAFNDFDERKLKRGIGAGFRWYTMIGPIQLDIAQALDQAGKPWRVHFTIGTKLL